ncbi:MAG TPA: NADH-quinone oxidoreductase subunit NuoE [Chloroflexota bacterium]|nr:NADH-quinone oxidoreductase subunit NuoE [Chloroflexota bacterium]
MGVLSNEAIDRIARYKERYPDARSALLPALHVGQNEVGWVSPQVMEEVGQLLGVATDQVEEVASFYSMLYTEPVGTYVLEVCKTAPCSFLGADEIIDYISQRLGIQPGQTTADGMFTLFRVECLAACHRAPVMQANHRYVQDLTREKIDAFIDEARRQQSEAISAPGFEMRRARSESVMADQ